jgi:hypothetical protein
MSAKFIDMVIAGAALLICIFLVMAMPAIDSANDQKTKTGAEKAVAAEVALRQRIADKWPVCGQEKPNHLSTICQAHRYCKAPIRRTDMRSGYSLTRYAIKSLLRRHAPYSSGHYYQTKEIPQCLACQVYSFPTDRRCWR